MTTVALTAPSLDGWYSKKDATYFDGLRHDFLDRMPQNLDAHILEIGCGTGATGRVALSSGKCQRYVGVELMADAAAVARRDLSQVVVGNIEHLDADFPDAPFDALILSEVLEHLIDPWAALGKLSRVLKPGAKVFASSPNVAHWWIIASLLGGRFDLTDRGVMDRTHFRWFTPETYAEMFSRTGFEVVETWPIVPLSIKQKALTVLTGGRAHLFWRQICLEAVWRGAKG